MRDVPIVYFGNDFFAENRTSAHHIARRLAGKFRVLYVESPGLRAPQATGRDFSKLFNKLARTFDGPRQLEERLWHMTIPQVPFRGIPGVAGFNRWFSVSKMRSTLKNLRMERPISWFTVPHVGSVLGQLNERLSVYYCVDDYAALPDVNVDLVRGMDDDMTQRSDLIFAVSKHLQKSKLSVNRNTVYSPHGVDVEMYQRTLQPGPKMADWPKPVVGYFGVLDKRIDIPLLEKLTEARPGWTFALIGRAATEMGQLTNRKNVQLVGTVKYETLPDWARQFDVCLMPYRQGDFAKAANPLKLREYLATGRPVVSTPMPEAEPFSEHLLLAETPEQFLSQLENGLERDSAAARQGRLDAVGEMSWDARFQSVLDTVGNQLAGNRA
jgi:glycosyltransferase involved in cell wall biosynthesis